MGVQILDIQVSIQGLLTRGPGFFQTLMLATIHAHQLEHQQVIDFAAITAKTLCNFNNVYY
jgi:hypothetical protein